MIKAVIFDFDGVVVDSHGTINKLFVDVFKDELEIKITEKDFARFPGMRFEKRMKILTKENGKRISKEKLNEIKEKAHFEYYTNRSNHVMLFDGAIDLFEELKENNIKIALGTNGSRSTVMKMLESKNIKDYFDSIVAYDDVAHGKPAPDMFLRNAEILGLNNGECIVIEDSLEGIKAAKQADMKVIAVSTTMPKDKLKDADMIVDTVKDLDVKIIQELK